MGKDIKNCIVFVFLILPGLLLGILTITTFSFSLIYAAAFNSFNLDSIKARTKEILLNRITEFFDQQTFIIKKLEKDLTSGEFTDQDSVEEYERLGGTLFKENENLAAMYMSNNNRKTHKLHREMDESDFVAVQIREYINSSYTTRYDKISRTNESFAEYSTSPKIMKLYYPFLKSWYIAGTENYPGGVWSGPDITSSTDCSSAKCYEPIIVYIRKVIWRNTSKSSVFKIKINIKKISDYIKDLESDYLKILIIKKESFIVVGSRNLENSINSDENRFKKIWELKESPFFFSESYFVSQILQKKDTNYFFFDVDNEPIKSAGWMVVCYFDKYKYQEPIALNFTVMLTSIIVSMIVLVFVLLVIFGIFISLFYSNYLKVKEIKLANTVAHSISIFAYDSVELKKLLEKNPKKLSPLVKQLRDLWKTFLMFKKFIPQSFYMQIREANLISGQSQISKAKKIEKNLDTSSMFSETISDYSYCSEKTKTTLDAAKEENKLKTQLEIGVKEKRGIIMNIRILDFTKICCELSSRNIAEFFEIIFSTLKYIILMNNGIIVRVFDGRLLVSLNLTTKSVDYVKKSMIIADKIRVSFKEEITKKLRTYLFPIPHISLIIVDGIFNIGNLGSKDYIYYAIQGEGKVILDSVNKFVTRKRSILFDKDDQNIVILINNRIFQSISSFSLNRIVGYLDNNMNQINNQFFYQVVKFSCRGNSEWIYDCSIPTQDGEFKLIELYNKSWELFVAKEFKESSKLIQIFLNVKAEDKLALQLHSKILSEMKYCSEN